MVSAKAKMPYVSIASEKVWHVLFGSDYPHTAVPVSTGFTKFINEHEYEMNDEKRKKSHMELRVISCSRDCKAQLQPVRSQIEAIRQFYWADQIDR